jgi:hypothetical protein
VEQEIGAECLVDAVQEPQARRFARPVLRVVEREAGVDGDEGLA